MLRKASGRLEIKNADDRKQIAIRKAVFVNPDFKALWDRVKQRTTYRVAFDNDKLVKDCITALQKSPRPACSGARLTLPLAKGASRPRRRPLPRRWCWTNPTWRCPTC